MPLGSLGLLLAAGGSSPPGWRAGDHRIERHQLDHLARHGVQREAVTIQHLGKSWCAARTTVAERLDRALLLEQRGGVQAAPRAQLGPDSRDLQRTTVRVTGLIGPWTTATCTCNCSTSTTSWRRVARTRVRPMQRGDRRSPTASACSVQGIGHVGVQRGCDRERLRGVDHLRESGRSVLGGSSSPGSRGLPIEVPFSGSIQSTHGVRLGTQLGPCPTSPVPSVTVNAARVAPSSR